MPDDPVIAGLQRIHAHSEQMVLRADELEVLINRLFDCLRQLSDRVYQLEAEHARLTAEAPRPRPH
jgi:hypothetical protein